MSVIGVVILVHKPLGSSQQGHLEALGLKPSSYWGENPFILVHPEIWDLMSLSQSPSTWLYRAQSWHPQECDLGLWCVGLLSD